MTFSLSSPIIKRSGPNAVVYDLSDPSTVAITLPVGSNWTSGLHWHETHIEYLRVIKGSIEVTLGNQRLKISAWDAITEIKVDKGVWHEWKRSDTNKGDDVVVLERTDPHDGQKAVFFWNLNGVLFNAQHASVPPYMPGTLHGWLMGFWINLRLFTIFNELDNFPIFINFQHVLSKSINVQVDPIRGQHLLRGLDRLISHLILQAASWTAWLLGIQAVDEQFTPKGAMARWKQSKRRK
jgi:hypothetical protein